MSGTWASAASVRRGANVNSHSFTFLHARTSGHPTRASAPCRPKCSKGRRTYQAVVTTKGGTVRVFVVVLIGLVVVLAVLTEVCLLQAASMRRKVRSALPPPEDGEEADH